MSFIRNITTLSKYSLTQRISTQRSKNHFDMSKWFKGVYYWCVITKKWNKAKTIAHLMICTVCLARMVKKLHQLNSHCSRDGLDIISTSAQHTTQNLIRFNDVTWWRHPMEPFSALLAIYAGNSPVSGEFPAQRPVTRSIDVFFDLRLNKLLNKQL